MHAESLWFVYILSCADNTLYTGITTDIERRLEEHNHDDIKSAKYTRARRPLVLVYTESVLSRQAAASREYAIKKLSRKNKIKLIEERPHA